MAGDPFYWSLYKKIWEKSYSILDDLLGIEEKLEKNL